MFKMIVLTLAGLGLVMTIGGRDFTQDELAAMQAEKLAEKLAAKNAERFSPSKPEIPAETVKPNVVQAALMTPELDTPEVTQTAATPVRDIVIPAVLLQPDNLKAEKPAQVAQPAATYRVTGSRVNVRSGPSTDFAVTDQVVAGDLALVVEQTANGWAHIRIEGDGVDGYMSSRFLEPVR